jgi:hypothetical protein
MNQYCQSTAESLFAVIGFVIVGACCCTGVAQDGGDRNDEPLNWKQAEAALKSPKIRTISELFVQLSKEPITDRDQKWFADTAKREAKYMSLDKYLSQFYQQGADYQEAAKTGVDMSLPAIRKRLALKVEWKSGHESLDSVSRVYTLNTSYPTKAERIAHWDLIIWYEILTDDKGNILGWTTTKK